VRLYLDNNVYVHAQDVGQQAALRAWLRQERHKVVLSDTLLGETLRIPDAAMRHDRLRFLADLPSVRLASLGEMQAREFVNEVRRLRPDWRRLPVGSQSTIGQLRALRRKGWARLNKDPDRLVTRTGNFTEVEERGIQAAMSSQRTIRNDLLEQRKHITGVRLGPTDVSFRRLDLDDQDDFCRFESLLSWYQATFADFETLSEYGAYVHPFLRRESIPETEFASFWIGEVDLARMPSGHATSLVTYAQLRRKVEHGNSADTRHAGHLLDAELMITQDRGFFAALQLATPKISGAATPVLLDRDNSDLVGQLAAAV
jgi:hypothetical protein